jgi:hypothetical protein
VEGVLDITIFRQKPHKITEEAKKGTPSRLQAYYIIMKRTVHEGVLIVMIIPPKISPGVHVDRPFLFLTYQIQGNLSEDKTKGTTKEEKTTDRICQKPILALSGGACLNMMGCFWFREMGVENMIAEDNGASNKVPTERA